MGDGVQGGPSKSILRKSVNYVVSGGVAGMISRTCVAPIERVKIVYQVSRSHVGVGTGYSNILPRILEQEGVLALWKGNSAAVARVIPYMAIQFLMYETYHDLLESEKNPFLSMNAPVVWTLGAGSLAGLTAVIATYPLDVVRARLAMQNEGVASTAYKGFIDCLRTIPREEGYGSLYRGMATTMLGNAPYTGLKFATYEAGKQIFKDYLSIDEKDLTGPMRVTAGSSAGLIALTFVYPFDVIRRRMQTHRGGKAYPSVYIALKTIFKEEGLKRGLYKGLTLNYLKTLPNVAIYMSVYDYIKLRMGEF